MSTRLAFVVPVVALAACFGSGAAPTAATDATPVMVLINNGQCDGMQTYLGSVAIGPGSQGYTVALPWQGPQCGNNNNNGGQLPIVQVEVLGFGPGDGELGSADGSAGTAAGETHPRVAVDAGGTGAYAFVFGTNPNGAPPDLAVTFGSNGLTVALGLDDTTSIVDAAGLALIGDQAWIAVSEPANAVTLLDPDEPSFPCCDQPALGPATVAGGLWRADAAGAVALTTAPVFPTSLPDPIVANGSAVYFVQHGTGAEVAELEELPIAGSGASDLVQLDALAVAGDPIVPVGVAAGTDVAWAFSIDAGVDTSHALCTIALLDGGAAPARTLFTTTAFSCMGLAIDDDAVYFAIVHDDGASGALHGDGVGRVAISDGSLTSAAFDMAGDYAGPRRVYVDATSVYAVDPQVIGRVAKTDIMARHDF